MWNGMPEYNIEGKINMITWTYVKSWKFLSWNLIVDRREGGAVRLGGHLWRGAADMARWLRGWFGPLRGQRGGGGGGGDSLWAPATN